jgi:PP-loop superfamily ATP-utilizing enzyme
VEEAESALRALGVTGDLRVRHFGMKARVEMGREQLAYWAAGDARVLLEAALISAGYDEVETVGYRSGALNELPASAALSGD